MSSPNRQYKIMNTFTEDEVKYIQKKMSGYENCEIKYSSFNEINKKYLSRQTKQELYDTCEAQKKEIQELKKQADIRVPKAEHDLLEKYKKKCIELKKENEKLLKVAEGKNKIYDTELFEDNKQFAEENLELLKGVEERDEYIEKVQGLVRSLDKIMEAQKKEIQDLKEVNDGLCQEVEDYEDSWEEATAKIEKDTKQSYENKVKNRERTISSLQEQIKKLQETVKKYEVVSPFLDHEQIQKTVIKNDEEKKQKKKQKKEVKVQFKSSPVKKVEKKVVKKNKYEEKYNEMNDILSKYQ
jgi:hypothetical protein